MGGIDFTVPAATRRAFFFFAVAIAATAFGAPPPTNPPPLAQTGKPDAAETARILNQFRHSGWAGYIEFDLRAMPRRGDVTIFHGRLWGGQNDQGAITRIEVTDAKAAVHRLLLQNGDHAAVWRWRDGKIEQVPAAAVSEPLIPGVEVTAFDLQMPYLYWPEVTVDSVTRVRGRPAYVFVFTPPATDPDKDQPLKTVRAYFDAQFNCPVQTELVGSKGVLKSSSLVDLKKVGEQWIPKSFDIRNDVTRDKTRFEVTGAALNLPFGANVFAPASLSENAPPPAADRVVHIEQ